MNVWIQMPDISSGWVKADIAIHDQNNGEYYAQLNLLTQNLLSLMLSYKSTRQHVLTDAMLRCPWHVRR